MTPNQLERLKAALSDRYRIERPIGSGGMATVYLAEDRKHRRKVAVKVLRPELGASLGAQGSPIPISSPFTIQAKSTASSTT
jgi:serine/threonine-protein kinase